MKRLHHPIACLLISFLLLSVASWAQSPQSLVVAVAYAPKTLNPALATDAASARLLQLTHPALLQWSKTYQPIGLVAQECHAQTPTQVICNLANRTYTNGDKITAPSIAAWFQVLQNTPQSPLSGPLKDVRVTALSPSQLLFELPKPSLTFMSNLTEIPIAHPTKPEVGAGPYRLVKLDELGNTTFATTQKNLPPILKFQFVADATTRLLKLKKGEVDVVMNDISPELYQWAQKQGFQTLSIPGTSYTYLGLNMQNEVLENPWVRQALAQSLNRADIRRYLLAGLATPASTMLPPTHPAAWHAPEEPYAPAEAEETLDEIPLLAGPDGIRFKLTLLTSTDSFVQRVAQTIQSQLKKIGVEVELRPTEWASFYDAVKKGQYDMVLLTWTGEQQPDFYYQVFHSSQVPPVGLNRGRVKDEQIDALTQRIHTSAVKAEQISTTIQLQQVLAQFRPSIPLYRRHHVLVMGHGVKNCQLLSSGAYHGLAQCQK